jgi:ankyrin repeat protein
MIMKRQLKKLSRFRWVACQIEELKRCQNQRVLIKTLKSLPKSLESVYDQILQRIDKKEITFAKVILQWLLLGMRLFTVEELAIVLTFDQFSDETFDTSRKVSHADNVIHLCHSLVMKATNNMVQLAHASVKEHFLHKPRSILLSDVQSGHGIMAHFCLWYIQEDKKNELKETQTFRLWHYSIWHWTDHYKLSNKNSKLQAIVLKFLCDEHGAVKTWAKHVSKTPAWIYPSVTPLDYAAELGLEDIVEKLIMTNKWYQKYSEAAQLAAQEGHIGVIKLLLDKGADVNVQHGEYCNALQAASYNGHDDMVRLLLDRGANVNARGGKYCNALQAASSGGHGVIVRILLGKGAYVNAQGGHYSNALLAASFRGHADIVRLLLDEGADVNAQGGYYGNALQAASSMGHVEIVRLLLYRGANVDEVGGFEYGTALIAALKQNHTEIARLLLDKGANVNMGVPCHYPLEIASLRCDTEFVKLLLDKGAYINVQGERYGGALQAAALQANVETVKLLLDRGADVNARGGEYGSALQAASAYGISQVVRLLLDKKPDVNAKGGKYGNALQAAMSQGHMRVAELLFDRGAIANKEFRGSQLNIV